MAKDHGHEKARQGAAGRAARAVSAWDQRPFVDEPYARRTRHGEVHLAAVAGIITADGLHAVEVRTAGQTEGGDPHFIIVNPPGLAEDPNGPIELNGRRFRDDPLAALAEVVAQHGGAISGKRKRRTRG